MNWIWAVLLLEKKNQLLELQMVDKGFGKYQLLDTIYYLVKKMVYMYGS
jgi:hypothetical protein